MLVKNNDFAKLHNALAIDNLSLLHATFSRTYPDLNKSDEVRSLAHMIRQLSMVVLFNVLLRPKHSCHPESARRLSIDSSAYVISQHARWPIRTPVSHLSQPGHLSGHHT